MKKILLVLMALLLLSGCSSPKGEYQYKERDDDSIVDLSLDQKTSSTTSTSISTSKLVYRATIELQTQKFDESNEKIKQLVKKYNGFFEASQVTNGSYFSATNYRLGKYTVRIPTENYNSFIEEIEKEVYVSGKSETVENISQSYYEVETHIKSIQIEIARLQELMSKAENMSDLITIEKALTEAENELEHYQTSLAQYDTLIDYSTITLSLQEVVVYQGSNESFFEEIKNAFVSGITDFVYFLKDLSLFIIENIITIIIVIIIIIVIKKKKVFSKIKEAIFKKVKEK